MRTLLQLALWTSLVGAVPAMAADPAAGPVSVEFVQPEAFTDVNDRMTRTAPEKNPNLYNLRQYTAKRAARYLSGGQTLQIRYTDIDLAGDHHPQMDPALSDVRLVTRLYPPRLKFTWALHDASGTVIRSGEADLRDLAFDAHSTGTSTDSLRFEKALLAKWMRKELGSH